jgi:hypothetical protein
VTVPFGDRYAVQRLADGGIVIDLATGDFTRLNVTAAAICQALVSTDDPSTVAGNVAAQLGTTRENAVRAIESTTDALARPAPRRTPVGALHYRRAPDGGGYELLSAGVPRLSVSNDARFVRALPGPAIEESQLYEYVRSVAPKILFVRGTPVIHGAACVVGNDLLAVCGESGAGKTTSVRALVEAGARTVSEDLLVVASETPLAVYVNGEKFVHGWARAAAKQLLAARDRTISTSDLEKRLAGETLPVDRIWTIAADRRGTSEQIAPCSIGPTDAVIALMSSLFLGAASEDGWRQFLATTGAIAASAPVFAVAMPTGLDRLKAAAKLYTESSIS